MAVELLLFAQARDAAGVAHDSFDPGPLAALLDEACRRYGHEFASVLDQCRVWVNGDEPAEGGATPVTDGSEVAVLPPVSGG